MNLTAHGIFKPYEHLLRIGEVMARVRGDPITTALAHPTRRNAYIQLCQTPEMSTVQLQEALSVDRYNLYHHLKKLASLNLVENHRDQGRARWWRVADRVDLPELVQPSEPGTQLLGTAELSRGAIDDRESFSLKFHSAHDKVAAKQFIEQLAELYGFEVELEWNFIPEELILFSKKR